MANFEDIKQAVRCDRLLADQGIMPVSQHNGYLMYHSPLREGDKKPSFTVYANGTKWMDHGTNLGGDVIDLYQMLWHCARPREAAEALAARYDLNTMVELPRTASAASGASSPNPVTAPSRHELISAGPIETISLQRYVVSRSIPVDVARLFLKEIHFKDTFGKEMYGVGLQTLNGGYAVRGIVGNYKTFVGPAGISLVGGVGSGEVAVFEGMFDLLSYLVDTRGHDGDAVVLNSTANVGSAISVLARYDLIECYLDRDAAGAQALLKIKQEFPTKTFDCSSRYEGHNDYNEFLIN